MPASCDVADILHYMFCTAGKCIRQWYKKELVLLIVTAMPWAVVPKVASAKAPELSAMPHLLNETMDATITPQAVDS